MSQSYDYIIVGAGVVGLTLARELSESKAGRILVLEKEPHVGQHASGRNSGVVHAGIYYSSDSLKARFCVEGARRMLKYCEENDLPVLKCGKVIVATRPDTVGTLETLLKRATENGVVARKVDLNELKELEPEAKSHGYAIWSPDTAVIDSKAVMQKLLEDVRRRGAEVVFGAEVLKVDQLKTTIHTANGGAYRFGFLFNAAGTYADKIAHAFGVGLKYRILPFKGLYWKATETYAKKITRLIYPAPDVNMPFLGVHITRTIDGKVLFGPTAIPAFGRENYGAFENISFKDFGSISWNLSKMLLRNPGGFRDYAFQEMGRYRARNFFKEASTMAQSLRPQDIDSFYKVGIRAQLMDTAKGRLEMDFVVEKGPRSLHVLNAISPAFTSSFAFASHLVNESHK